MTSAAATVQPSPFPPPLKTDPHFKKSLLAGGLWSFGTKIGSVLAGLVVNALLARLVAPEEVGAYFLAFGVATTVALLARSGLDQTAVRLVAENLGLGRPAEARGAARKIVLIAVVATVAAFALLWLGWRPLSLNLFHSETMSTLGVLSGLWMAGLVFHKLFAEIFRGFNQIALAGIFENLLTNLLTAAGFAVIWAAQGRATFSAVVTISAAASLAATTVAGVILWPRMGGGLRGGATVSTGLVLDIAWPILLINLMGFLVTQADLLVLGALRPQEEVALYGSASRVAMLVGLPNIILSAVLSPHVAALYARGDTRELGQLLQRAAAMTGVSAVFLVAVFELAGDRILGLLFGEFYGEAGTLLALLCLGKMVAQWMGLSGYALMLTGNQRVLMWITVVSGGLGILGGIVLAERFGAVGMAAAMALSTAVQQVMMMVYVRKRCGVWAYADPRTFPQVVRMVLRLAR